MEHDANVLNRAAGRGGRARTSAAVAPRERRSDYGLAQAAWSDRVEQMSLTDLRAAVATMPAIEQAKGMIMGLYGIDADSAFHLLRRWSQNGNVKLQTLAAAIIDAAAAPDPEPFGALRRYIGTVDQPWIRFGTRG